MLDRRNHSLRARAWLPIALLAVVALSPRAAGQDDDPKKLLKSREVKERLMGIFLLERDGADKAEDLLVTALDDKDWEVVEQAAVALAKRGGADAIAPLVTVAGTAPARRVRLAAARALAAIDAEAGAELVAKKAKGDRAEELIDLLGVIGGPAAVATLEKYSGAKDPAIARAARLALGSAGGVAQHDAFVAMLGDRDLEVRLAGVNGLARTGEDRALAPLLERLAGRTSDVEERRLRGAVREALTRGASFDTLSAALTQVGPQHVRLFADLAHDEALAAHREACVRRIVGLVGASGGDIRAAAVHALATLGDGDVIAKLAERATGDDDPRVRLHALRARVAIQPESAGSVAAAVLSGDRSPVVREDAAALCGIHGLTDTADALVAALDAKEWPVFAAAAISLGKLRHAPARDALAARMDDKDWRIRGAAALGLAWLRDKDATDLLIERLSDRDMTVRHTIQHALGRITGQLTLEKKGQWEAWWRKNRDTVTFIDRQADARKAGLEKYSLGGAYTFYEDLDVVAILSPRDGGDHIEQLLERYKIRHRTTGAGEVPEAGLHPFAIAFSNCSGEILPEDVDRVEWFVRCGGYLFASCWALTETVNKAFPGIAQMQPTPTQVMDEVPAEPVLEEGLMRGVLRPATRTRYVLEGSHLISVQDHERFTVLIDSPACAARWGEGNLAGFFTVGHGLVFDSANHFDLQGMTRDVPKSAKDRRAMAMDVLGYDHDELRDLDHTGAFKSEKKAMEELEDLSMFRLITNFVMQKRRQEL